MVCDKCIMPDCGKRGKLEAYITGCIYRRLPEPEWHEGMTTDERKRWFVRQLQKKEPKKSND